MKLRDPLRIADESGGGELAEAIRASRQTHGSPQQVDQLAARVAAFSGADLESAATVSALSPLVKAGLGGVVLVAAGLAFWLASGRSVEAPQRTAPRAPAGLAEPAPPRSAPPSVVEAVEPAEPAAPRRRSLARAVRTPVVAAPERELVLLERSRAALDRDPALAFAEVQAHERAYPQGVFAQEREVLAIEALLKLRRRGLALARAARFMQRYPESSHVRRVRALLERTGVDVPATIEARPGDSTGNADRERAEHETER